MNTLPLTRCFLLAALPLGLLGFGPAQAQRFAPVATYPLGTGSNPVSVAAGDVNNDGYPDIISANTSNSTVGVLLNKQNGTFAPAATYPTGTANYPNGLAVADINQDGYLDVVVATRVGSLAVVLLNQQNGTFGAAVPYGAGSYSEAVAVADVNGDGRPDLLTANGFATHTASVLLNNQNGTFAAPVAYAAGSYPLGVAVGDVNADGYADLAVSDYSTKAQVLINQKNGTFAPAVGYSAGASTQPAGIILGDVNLDGYPDLATANYTGTVSVLLNNRNGTFSQGLTYDAGGYTGSVALGDLDGDDYPDLATANYSTSTAGVLLSRHNGTFAPPITYSTGTGSSPRGIAVSDVNGDSRPDLILANYNNNSVAVLLNTTSLASRAATLPGATATLHPNPANAGTAPALTLAGLPATVAHVQITVHDATGRAVGQHTLTVGQGIARAELPTAGLAAGLYVVRLAAYDQQGALAGALSAQHLSVR